MSVLDNMLHRAMTPIIGIEDDRIELTPSGFDTDIGFQHGSQYHTQSPVYNANRNKVSDSKFKGINPKSTMQMVRPLKTFITSLIK